MLHYSESRDSEQWLRAPLVLLPVELHAKSARAGYTHRRAPTTTRSSIRRWPSTCARSFGITLPELPDSETIADDYDLQTFLEARRGRWRSQQGWSVKTDMCSGCSRSRSS